jgi:hypothetical protein
MHEALEVGKLLILAVAGIALGAVEVVEKFDTDNGVDVKEKDKERHKT